MLSTLNAIGALLTGNIQYGQIPDTPDDVTVLNWYGGLEPDRVIGHAKPSVRRMRLQVFVRGTNFGPALNTVEACRNLIIELSGWLGNMYVLKFDQIADIYQLGRDEKKRYQFSINFYAIVDEMKEE